MIIRYLEGDGFAALRLEGLKVLGFFASFFARTSPRGFKVEGA